MKVAKEDKGRKRTRRKRGIRFIEYDYESAFRENVENLNELFVENLLKHRYKCVYAMKEIRAGEQLEIEIYPEFKKMSEVPMEGRKKDNSKAQNNLNDKNSRKHVERLLNENFGNDDIWITLNYAPGEEPGNMKEAVKNMQNFINRINYRRRKMDLEGARYIYITEYNPECEIRWHHHLVMDGDMDMDIVESVWKKGSRNRIRKLDKDKYGLAGMANYITKEKHRKKGERRWNGSKNLKKYKTTKVHSKRKEERSGSYVKIGKYVEGFVRDQQNIEDQAKKWFPDYEFTESGVFYNEFNGLFYINARMRKEEERPYRKRERKKE